MNEVKTPKKPLLYYYGIVMLILALINFLAVPWLARQQIQQVDYGTFMQMTENREIANLIQRAGTECRKNRRNKGFRHIQCVREPLLISSVAAG